MEGQSRVYAGGMYVNFQLSPISVSSLNVQLATEAF